MTGRDEVEVREASGGEYEIAGRRDIRRASSLRTTPSNRRRPLALRGTRRVRAPVATRPDAGPLPPAPRTSRTSDLIDGFWPGSAPNRSSRARSPSERTLARVRRRIERSHRVDSRDKWLDLRTRWLSRQAHDYPAPPSGLAVPERNFRHRILSDGKYYAFSTAGTPSGDDAAELSAGRWCTNRAAEAPPPRISSTQRELHLRAPELFCVTRDAPTPDGASRPLDHGNDERRCNGCARAVVESVRSKARARR